MSEDCLFCKIIDGDIPATKVLENEHVVAFRDIAPKAPVHVLVIPRTHVKDVAAAAAEVPQELAAMALAAQEIADAECGGEFRWVFNTGASAGQSVFHVHGHVLGGTELEWNPA
ncbi:histidine triad nucleotide-binding protein [Demequina sp. B12]|uniref:histidine triad nucleotide-binding protein n=1 Tax=Demequina sp. B12 TaxID=2992757 RepID=UPI00237C3A61|nr:histidine triad nucleotide-binding protein [Demequina sp. B12]MDE0572847.1 histidine triad nucleotide-binding protein [Demequina sp. B12]